MNENPDIASAWTGRMLMHIECTEEQQKTDIHVKQVDKNIVQEAIAQGYFKENLYSIIADVFAG